MTPEQITALLGIIGQTPGQVLIAAALYILYRDVRDGLKTHLEWHSEQIEQYMKRDREIIEKLVTQKIEVASNWKDTDNHSA